MPRQHQLNPDRWVETHGELLMGYAVARVRNHETAQDLVQDTFLSALQARDQFEGRGSERTWLVGILKRKILDHHRRCLRERPVTEIGHDEAEDEFIQKLFDEKGMWKSDKPQAWSDPRRAVDAKEFMALLQMPCQSPLSPGDRFCFAGDGVAGGAASMSGSSDRSVQPLATDAPGAFAAASLPGAQRFLGPPRRVSPP